MAENSEKEKIYKIQLQGKILITGEIKAVTGLHIGGSGGALEIGGVDNPVIRNPLTNEPYIPGSTLRGKTRSLLDRHFGNALNNYISRGRNEVRIHTCKNAAEYKKCAVCHAFGIASDTIFEGMMPTRLIVRDAYLTPDSREALDEIDTDMPFTEVKTEVAIDRITSAATPRQNERVPAGASFGPFEMVYSLYVLEPADLDPAQQIQRELKFFAAVLEGMELLEDDYIGGNGSRGSGKIRFHNLQMIFKSRQYYQSGKNEPLELIEGAKVSDLRKLNYTSPIEGAINQG